MSFSVTNVFSGESAIISTDMDQNFTDVEDVVNGASALGTPAAYGMSPVGSIVAWHKTFNEVSSTGSQTNTSNGTSQLIDSNADFVTDGITAGMIVHNEDDDEFAIVETVTDLNTLVLVNDSNAGTSNSTTFDSATSINYAIYATPELPDNWLECDGQVVSDADSPYNGANLPNMNGTTQATKHFIRGSSIGSGDSGGNATHTHGLTFYRNGGDHTADAGDAYYTVDNANNTPPKYMEMVWIIRIK